MDMLVLTITLLPATYAGGAVAGTTELTEPVASRTSPFKRSTVLQRYWNNLNSGPGLFKWDHYFDMYDKHFARFRGTDVRMAEVGVFSGGSLKMWRWHFGERARIYGIDISNRTQVYEKNEHFGRPDGIFVGDQGDPDFLKRFVGAVPQIDIFIDDGSHAPEHQKATFKAVWPHISPRSGRMGAPTRLQPARGRGQPDRYANVDAPEKKQKLSRAEQRRCSAQPPPPHRVLIPVRAVTAHWAHAGTVAMPPCQSHLPTGCTYSSKVVRDSSKFELRIWLAVCVPGTSDASGTHGRSVRGPWASRRR